MTPRKKLSALLLCMLTSIALIFAFSLPAIAGAEGENIALQKNKKLSGFIIFELGECQTSNMPYTCDVIVTFVGECVYNVGDIDVAFSTTIPGYEITLKDFEGYTAEDLVGREYSSGIGGLVGCFDPEDTLIITRVHEFYNCESVDDKNYIGAKVTIRVLK